MRFGIYSILGPFGQGTGGMSNTRLCPVIAFQVAGQLTHGWVQENFCINHNHWQSWLTRASPDSESESLPKTLHDSPVKATGWIHFECETWSSYKQEASQLNLDDILVYNMQNLIWICRCSIMLRSHGNSYVHLLHSFHQVQSSIIVPWPLAHLSASLLHDERHGGALIEQSQLAILANGQWQSMIVTDSHWQVSGKFMHLMRLGHHLQKVTSMCPSERLPMTCIRIPLAKCNEKHLHATPGCGTWFFLSAGYAKMPPYRRVRWMSPTSNSFIFPHRM